MIKDIRRQHIQTLVLSVAAITGVAAIFNLHWPALAISLVAYITWNLRQQNRMFRWLRDTSQPLPEAEGLWGSVFDHLYSVQRRHSLEKRRLNRILDRIQSSTAALQDGVVMVSGQGVLEWWNDSAQKLLRFQDQDKGQLITNLIREPNFQDFFDTTSKTSLTINAPGRDHIFLEFSLTVYGEDERLILIRDVSRLKQLEQMRQDFVANAGHELRTPLTVLQGYLETFIDLGDILPDRMHKPLRQMQE